MRSGWRRPQITIKTFILATSLIGAGIGCYFAGARYLSSDVRDHAVWWRPIFAAVQILSAGPLVGAGLFAPFQRARLGAYIGFFIPVAAVICLFVFLVGWKTVWEESAFRSIIAITALVIILAVFNVARAILRRRIAEPTSEDAISN